MSAQARHPATEAFSLTSRLFEVVDRAKRDFDRVAEGVGLTPLQARALLTLQDPLPMRELAQRMQCDASNVTGLADRLERAGVVERVPGEDRRVKLLSTTSEGERLRGVLADGVGAGSTVMAKLTRAERTQLGALLDKLLSD
jgi:DNA-binding MarR family transcriptional regulator